MDIQNMVEKLDNVNAPFYELFDYIDENKYSEATNCIQQYFNCDVNTAKIVLLEFKEKCYDVVEEAVQKAVSQLSPQEIAHNNAVAQELLKKPKCPTCQSTNVQKIDVFDRIGSVYLLGFFSNKLNKSFECKNCGYTW